MDDHHCHCPPVHHCDEPSPPPPSHHCDEPCPPPPFEPLAARFLEPGVRSWIPAGVPAVVGLQQLLIIR
ncbi:hypothetical protein ACP70R_044138 [Stipagrostis hirtigluma subsp. patula]